MSNTNNTVYTRKNLGRPLTYYEMDANFSVLDSLSNGNGNGSLSDYYFLTSDEIQHLDNNSSSGITFNNIQLQSSEKITIASDDFGNSTNIVFSTGTTGVYLLIGRLNVGMQNAGQSTFWTYLTLNGQPISGSTHVFSEFGQKNTFEYTVMTNWIQEFSDDDVLQLRAYTAPACFLYPDVLKLPEDVNDTLLTNTFSATLSIIKLTGGNGGGIVNVLTEDETTYVIQPSDIGNTIFASPLQDANNNSNTILNIIISDAISGATPGSKIKIVNTDENSNSIGIVATGNTRIFSLDAEYNGVQTYLNIPFLSCELTYLGINPKTRGQSVWFLERTGNVYTDYLNPGFVPVSGNYSETGSEYGGVDNSTNESYTQLVSSGLQTNNNYTLIASDSGLSNVFAAFTNPNGYFGTQGINVRLGNVNGGGNGTTLEIDDYSQKIIVHGSLVTAGFIGGTTSVQFSGPGSWTPQTNFKNYILDMNHYNGQVTTYSITIDNTGNNDILPFQDGQEIVIRIINPSVNPFTVVVNDISGTMTFNGSTSLNLDGHRAFTSSLSGVSTMIGVTMIYDANNNNFNIISFV